uniref:Uncharacterized protein n=1 Tax=Nelumbo nucifera TaxID=4432 RepID=A0A822YUE0_NELNU|nr:TPA_asm: hypothetical protein HUJ06_011709 [Nelumbo nucifera]
MEIQQGVQVYIDLKSVVMYGSKVSGLYIRSVLTCFP